MWVIYTHFNINICKLLAPQMFISPNKWKSDGAKSRPYGGCFSTSNFRACSVSAVRATIWGQALSWSNNTLFQRIPQRFDCIAGFNLFTSMSLYRALVTVWPFTWKCTNTVPLKDGQHDFPSGSLCLEFFVSRRRWVLPLHRLSLILWFIMVHSGLVSCHNSRKASPLWAWQSKCPINRLLCTLVIITQYCTCSNDSCWILRRFHQLELACSHGFIAWSAVSLSQLPS